MTPTQQEDTTILQAEHIQFSYTPKKPVIRDISFNVSPGEIVGISGENGSGKSTLLKLLVGLLKPKKGTRGYSPQDVLLFENLTVKENFLVFGKGLGLSEADILKQADEIMERLNFAQYGDTLVKNLSGGTAQKTNFGISMLGDPDVLILDEPYQGMDYSSFTAFWEIQFEMRKKGKAIIIVSHLIEDKEKFTKSYHLIQGKLQGCTGDDCPVCCGDVPC